MANVDIDPPEAWLQNAPYQDLLTNKAISVEFAKQEAKANEAKRIYTLLGQFGLLAAFLTFTAVIYSLTLEPLFFPTGAEVAPPYAYAMRVGLGLLAMAGVAVQLFLLKGPVKTTWLNARFHAERLRSIKFQAFQEAACCGDGAVPAFTKRALGDLAVEFGDATAARHNFQPRAGLVAPSKPGESTITSGDAFDALKSAYQQLRIDRQLAYSIGEIKKINEERKLPAGASEVAFWAGAGLAYLDAILAFFNIEAVWLRPWLHFVTLELFVSSALLFVLERGRNYNLALERYEDYREQMLLMSRDLAAATTPAAFIECVKEVERQALRELKTFCREAEKSTYLI